jgi:hypothetical protein
MPALLVDFMDGESRRYEVQSDDAYTETKDGVLRVYDVPYYGSAGKVKTSLPIANIREFRWEGR